MNTLLNVIIFILFAYYLAALAERIAAPEIIEDGESKGLDQYYESEYLNTRDYYLAADHGFGHESDWDF